MGCQQIEPGAAGGGRLIRADMHGSAGGTSRLTSAGSVWVPHTMVSSSSAAVPQTMFAFRWTCPTRCWRTLPRRSRRPTRCLAISAPTRGAPDDVVFRAGAPHDVVFLVAGPHTTVSSPTELFQTAESHALSAQVVPQMIVSPPSVVEEPQMTFTPHAFAFAGARRLRCGGCPVMCLFHSVRSESLIRSVGKDFANARRRVH